MAAPSVSNSGSITSDGTEQAIATETGANVYQLKLILVNMVNGATPSSITIRQYVKLTSGGTEYQNGEWKRRGDQGIQDVWESPPVVTPISTRWTLQHDQGGSSPLAFPWATHKAQ